MRESFFEDFLQKYPENIEKNLQLCSRQLPFRSCRFDLVFTDQHQKTLLIEIKAREIASQDIGQIVRYRAELARNLGLEDRVMLVGTALSESIKIALEDVNIEWRVITEASVRSALSTCGDHDMLDTLNSGTITSTNRDKNNVSDQIEFVASHPKIRGETFGSGIKEPTSPSHKSLTLDDKYRLFFSNIPIGSRLTRKEIEHGIMDAFPDAQTIGGILPTDRCYNITNIGLPNPKLRIFNYRGGGMFEYLGEQYPFNGFVTWKNDRCGEWKNGLLTKWDNWPTRSSR